MDVLFSEGYSLLLEGLDRGIFKAYLWVESVDACDILPCVASLPIHCIHSG